MQWHYFYRKLIVGQLSERLCRVGDRGKRGIHSVNMEVRRGVFARCLKRVAPIGATLFFKYILQDFL